MSFDAELFWAVIKFFATIAALLAWLIVGGLCGYCAFSDDDIPGLKRIACIASFLLWVALTLGGISGFTKAQSVTNQSPTTAERQGEK